MEYIKVPNDGWGGINDVGFGDRIRHWTNAYILNQLNNFKFTMLVDESKWRETKYLNFPHTKTENHDCEIKVKNGVDFISEITSKITLKNTNLQNKIEKVVKDRIGIHIRHWPVFEDDFRPDKVERFDYIEKMKLLRKTLNMYPASKFYISSDVTYDEPSTGPMLPNFRKQSHWLSGVYRDYDVVDYTDILNLNNLLPNTVQDTNNPKWSRVLDDEGLCISTIMYDEKSHKVGLDEIEDMVIKRNIIDLFALIYSKEFIPSTVTGPQSSWSEFVESYRKEL